MLEKIDKERLQAYRDVVIIHDNTLAYKHRLEKQLSSIKSTDLSKPKVTSGSKPISSPEEFTQKLEYLNKKILEYKHKISSEGRIIESQIQRLTKIRQRIILIMYYLEGQETKDIIGSLYGSMPDFEEQKNFKYYMAYKSLKSLSIQNLLEISSKPFIKDEKQLNLDI